MTVAVRMLCASLAIALAPTAVAHADAIDDDYLSTLAGQGITGDPAQLIAAGHTVCSSASGTGTNLPAGLGMMLPMGYVMSSLRISAKSAQLVVNTAINSYCPQLLGPHT